MELILKSNNENSIAKIIALAKKLDIIIEQRNVVEDQRQREEKIKFVLNFKGSETSSFGDAVKWELSEREDRDLPFSK